MSSPATVIDFNLERKVGKGWGVKASDLDAWWDRQGE